MESNAIETAVATVFTNADDIVNNSMKLYIKIVTNILKNQDDPKYRRLNKDKVVAKLKHARGAVALLDAVGFRDEGTHYVLPAEADLSPLQQSHDLIQQHEPAKAKTEAQLQLEAVLAESKKRTEAARAEKQKRKSEMKQKIEANKKEKAADYKPPKASVAQKRNFGAVHKKLEFTSSKGG